MEAVTVMPKGWRFSHFLTPLPTTGTHSMRFERPLAASKGTQEGTWH